MFRVLLFLAFIPMFFNSAFAIDWVSLVNPQGNTVFLDKDSIKEYSGYYFYNIKFKDKYGHDTVVTLQSAKTSPLSARIMVYESDKYNALEGDYENITKNITHELEPVTYNSTVNTCYKEVKNIMYKKELPEITF